LLDATLPLLELSEVPEPTSLLCDDACCTDEDTMGPVVDAYILLLGGEAHWTLVCLLSTDASALDDVGFEFPAATAAFSGLTELK
jgi:hypothetical protein